MGILHDERIRHANDTLEAISGDFADLYQTIHPREQIETIRLYLHPTKKASAQFDGTLFGKQDASPVACLSESHLDTLGLCLFLALEKRETPNGPFSSWTMRSPPSTRPTWNASINFSWIKLHTFIM